jgi:hypothetical protein
MIFKTNCTARRLPSGEPLTYRERKGFCIARRCVEKRKPTQCGATWRVPHRPRVV